MSQFSKTLIYLGIFLIVAGLLASVMGKIPGLGRLPGDFFLRKNNFTFYFPLTTCLILSLVLTLLFSIFKGKL